MKKDKPLSIKSPVKIRAKRLNGGNKSLYLDIYDNGKRKREYLKLYLVPDKTEAAKEANRKTLELAEAIKTERALALQNKKNPFFTPEKKELKIPFATYMENEIGRVEQIRTKDYIRRYKSGLAWVKKFDSKTALEGVSKRWVQEFIHYLSITPGKYGKLLNQNTIHEYLTYIANILNNAVREGIIAYNPTKALAAVDRPKKYESKRDYLTEEEINRLLEVPSPDKYNHIRRAFLFACFCGLRYSDIQQLKWKDIKKSDSGFIIEKKIQKTQNMLCLPLNKKAIDLLPEKQDANRPVFTLPKSMVTVEAYIKVWSEFAQIDKHVTFHTSRHTFAVTILARGGDIYTLSKLLGHKRITTTQIYAEVLEENKRKTVDLLDWPT